MFAYRLSVKVLFYFSNLYRYYQRDRRNCVKSMNRDRRKEALTNLFATSGKVPRVRCYLIAPAGWNRGRTMAYENGLLFFIIITALRYTGTIAETTRDAFGYINFYFLLFVRRFRRGGRHDSDEKPREGNGIPFRRFT